MGGGMLLVLVLTVGKIDGGFRRVLEIGDAHGRFDMMHTELGFQSANIYGVIAFGFFVYLSGQAVTFTAVQRYVSMPNIAAARKSLVVNGVMTGVVGLVFFLCGSAIFAYYHQQNTDVAQVQASEQASTQSQNLYDQLKQSASQPNRQDQLLPRFIMSELPYNGLMGLMLAALFAAAMSSIDSGINSMTASIVCDWQRDQPHSLRQSRMLCAVFGVLTVALALVFFFAGGQVFPLMMQIAGMFLGLLLGLFLLGLLVDRADSWSATIGMIAGGLGIFAAIATGVSHWWYGAFGCLPVLLIGSLASLRNPGYENV
jgi:SSS family solute:Na+ symporter